MDEEKYFTDNDELYETRLLVFLEKAPQSNKYRQIILNQEQFRRLSECLGRLFGEKKDDGAHYKSFINVSDETYVLPDVRSRNLKK